MDKNVHFLWAKLQVVGIDAQAEGDQRREVLQAPHDDGSEQRAHQRIFTEGLRWHTLAVPLGRALDNDPSPVLPRRGSERGLRRDRSQRQSVGTGRRFRFGSRGFGTTNQGSEPCFLTNGFQALPVHFESDFYLFTILSSGGGGR